MTYKPYLCDYTHEGAQWSITIQATSFEDAQARCRQIYYARVVGTLEEEIPAFAGAGVWTRLVCWFRNMRRLRSYRG